MSATQDPGSREWKVMTLHTQGEAAAEVARALAKAGYPQQAVQGMIYAAALEGVAVLMEDPSPEKFDEVGLGLLDSLDNYFAAVQALLKETK